MGIDTMGKVLVTATIANLSDLDKVREGLLTEDQVRRVEVSDALVDTGATGLSMPKRLIEQLGIHQFRSRTARTSAGPVMLRIFGAVLLTIQDRDCLTDVTEIPD